MSDEYEFYQGVVLRQLVTNSPFGISVRPHERQGRINAFVINGRVGVFIKHSTKRMSPWRFTFNADQVGDLLDLTTAFSETFAVFVCDDDGLVTVSASDLYEIVSLQDSDNAWVKIERPPRAQYAVSGNKAELPYKVPTGVHQILEATRSRIKAIGV